jgi:hypothetical protein
VNWTAYGDVEFEGRVYGQKDREFDRFRELPKQSGEQMEMALSGPGKVKANFANAGWRIQAPEPISLDPWTYQAYLRQSRGEFCVAKQGYVSTKCGWFSDRSAAYLALGRPVVLQDTGFSRNLRCGEGLLAFNDVVGAVAAIKELRADYPRHCRAARAVAEEFFDSDRVLNRLIDQAM